MADKKIKVRTSITIDPDLLSKVRKMADKSVSSFIEDAVEKMIAELETKEVSHE